MYGVDRKALYPDGTACLYCTLVIEVDLTYFLLVQTLVVTLMVLDFRYWKIDYIGLISGAMLLVNGFYYKQINARWMPLKAYEDRV